MVDIIKKIHTLPSEPGVYSILDTNDKVIYVARAKNIKEKVYSHITNKSSRRNKMITQNLHDIEYEVIENKLDATRRELDLIRTHYPPLNGPRKGIKQYRFVKITQNEKFPRARKKKYIEDEDEVILGPFPKSVHIQRVMSLAANHYGIADCGKEIVMGDDHKIVRTCIRRRTKQCMRPCEVEVDEDDYKAALDRYIAFFEGESSELVNELEEEMDIAVKEQNFERAAKIRDGLESIKRIGL